MRVNCILPVAILTPTFWGGAGTQTPRTTTRACIGWDAWCVENRRKSGISRRHAPGHPSVRSDARPQRDAIRPYLRTWMSGRLHPMFTTRQSNNQEIVDYIGLLRSRGYVASFAKQRLSASLKAQHVADISASFSQVIAYFNSAEQASIQIKPVLQYYGILNLVKGLCGLKTPDGDEQESVNDHGLRRDRWNDHLVREVPNFLDLEVVTTTRKGGAFQQAIGRAWHRNVVDVESMYPGQPWRNTFIQQLGTPAFAEPKSCIRLRDVLARSRYVADTFATVVGESSKIHPVHMVAGSGQVGLYPAHWARAGCCSRGRCCSSIRCGSRSIR